jgi:hypothetical protein
MKKSVVFSAAFLLVLGLGIGITVAMTEDAHAIWECQWQCLFTTTWSHTTVPECPGNCPDGMIYAIYKKSTCAGGPLNCPNLNYVFGCWDGVEPPGCVLHP